MKADNGGEDFYAEEAPFFPDAPLSVDSENMGQSSSSSIHLRTDQIAAPTTPRMLRRRLMEEIRSISVTH